MRNAPLYAMNVFYYHWLRKKLFWPMAEQNIAKQEIQVETEKKIRWSLGDTSSHRGSKMLGNKTRASW